MTLTRSLDLWGLLVIVAAAVLLTLVDSPAAPRLPLGFLAVLFAPGYVLIAALFPNASAFEAAERVGLSIGVSIALISLLALVLSFSPWGITRESVALSVAATVFPLAAIALWRSQTLPADDLPPSQMGGESHAWLREHPAQAAVALLAILVVAVMMGWTLFFNQPPTLTEFYALVPEGLARGFPREARAGQPVQIAVSIANNERRSAVYRVEVRDGAQVLAAPDPVTVADGATATVPLQFTPVEPADPRTFDILLFTDGQSAPYRSLRFLIPVRPVVAVQPASAPAAPAGRNP